jgi:hypothetical protein
LRARRRSAAAAANAITTQPLTLRNFSISSSLSVLRHTDALARSARNAKSYGVDAMRLASTTSPMPKVFQRTPSGGLQYGSE